MDFSIRVSGNSYRMLILKKFAEPLPANPFSDSRMKDFNFAVTDFAANCRYAISIGVRFVA